jgi:hypothetical protein
MNCSHSKNVTSTHQDLYLFLFISWHIGTEPSQAVRRQLCRWSDQQHEPVVLFLCKMTEAITVVSSIVFVLLLAKNTFYCVHSVWFDVRRKDCCAHYHLQVASS